MSLIIEIIAAIFFSCAAISLLFISFSLYQIHSLENSEELDVTLEELEEDVPVSVKACSFAEELERFYETGPEIFEHSYDLQLLYLAREGALSQFEENSAKELDEYTTTPFIVSAFTWEETPEGYRYWAKLYRGYEKFLKGQE